MYKKIKPNNKVLKSKEFQKDKYKFNIILKNLASPELDLYSDESELEELIKKYFTDNVKDKFTCKKELYDILCEREFSNLNKDDYFEMGFLICRETKKPKHCDGILSKPNEKDIETLIEEFMKDDNFYLLRNAESKIVCMASYRVTEEQAKISHVYTPVEERKKGYAANLIYFMTNDILQKGLVPLLYTDYNYIPSNKAYINAGYEPEGILINFSCSR